MQLEIDEILYYGGLGAVLFAVILGVILFFIFRYRRIKLELKLRDEYGEMMSMSGGKTEQHTEEKK